MFKRLLQSVSDLVFCAGGPECHSECVGHRTTVGVALSVRVTGIEFRSPGLLASALTH